MYQLYDVHFFERFPNWLRYIVCGIAGIAMIVFLYLAIYLFPLYGFSVLAVLVLGISLHTFVPALFCIYTIFLIRRVNADTKKYWRGFVTGIALSIIVVTGYCVSWNNNLNAISKNFVQSTAASDHQLPSWARVAQRIPKAI